MNRLRSRRQGHPHGAAAVELAMSLPILVLLLFGTIESCTMIFLQQSLEIAAYEASRVAILPKVSASDVERTARDILAVRRVHEGRVSIELLTSSNSGGSFEPMSMGDHQKAPYGTLIRVNVSAPCNANAVFNLQFFGNRELTGSAVFMKEF